jgi:Tol biopolymer transport system component
MIVFDARQEGHSDIFVVNKEGGAHKRITSSESDDTVPCWSGDGKWIYFASNRSGELQIWRTPFNGGNPSQVTVNVAYAPRISSDGNWVYYSKKGTKAPLFKCPAEGGKEMIVFDFPLNWTEWCLADDGIYYINWRESNSSIEFFDFHTNKITRIVDVDIKRYFFPIISPDGQWLLFTQEDQNERDIILVENFQ